MSTETANGSRPSPSDLLRFTFFEKNSDGSWELKWSTFQALAIMVGVIMIIIFSGYNKSVGRTFAVSILLAGVALAIGVLVGFLFGVPKAASQPGLIPQPPAQPRAQPPAQPPAPPHAEPPPPPPNAFSGQSLNLPQDQPDRPAGSDREKEKKTPAFVPNTNLEQISDWLTKIIVGVGLVQLSTLPGKLRALAGYFATAFGAEPVAPSVVLAIQGYFGIFGFLLGYLWARLYLMKEFSEE
jgi:hypothetical protein